MVQKPDPDLIPIILSGSFTFSEIISSSTNEYSTRKRMMRGAGVKENWSILYLYKFSNYLIMAMVLLCTLVGNTGGHAM